MEICEPYKVLPVGSSASCLRTWYLPRSGSFLGCNEKHGRILKACSGLVAVDVVGKNKAEGM